MVRFRTSRHQGCPGAIWTAALLLLFVLTLPRASGPAWAQGAPSLDAGAPSRDGGTTRRDAAAPGGTRADGGPLETGAPATPAAPVDPITALQMRIVAQQKLSTVLRGMKAKDVALPPGLIAHARIDPAKPAALTAYQVELKRQQKDLSASLAEKKQELVFMTGLLEKPIKRAERLARRKRRVPASLAQKAKFAGEKLELVRLEHEDLQSRSRLIQAQLDYFERSRPAREEVWRQSQAQEQQLHNMEKEGDQAKAAQLSAEQARERALKQQRLARSEAERSLAGERARVEQVRADQARLRQKLARMKGATAKQHIQLERFRGGIAAKVDDLAKDWPATAPQYDRLYDQVVERVSELRPLAAEQLSQMIQGLPDAPHPGRRLSEKVQRVDKTYSKEVARLEKLRAKLATSAEKLEELHGELANARLELLQQEVKWLNDHRITIFQRMSEDKQENLSGLTRETVAQLTREIAQLSLDSIYWFFTRLHQLADVKRLIRDIFTIGSLLSRLIQLIILILFLRYILRHWDPWMRKAVRVVSRSVSLGRYAVPLAKLADALRHSGPALLAMITISYIYYRIIGGVEAATEFGVAYEIFFWIVIYRFQLRLVESGSKYLGLEETHNTEGREELEGPPTPGEVEQPRVVAEQHGDVVPASQLLVRSVRAATRYILGVVLVLQLTALAVGKGTIYELTARFSWWATLPFLFYFLSLWRPHIVRAYERLITQGREPGVLHRLVKESKDRFYGVFVIGVAFVVVLADRLASFGKKYLSSLDATKKLLAFIFRRNVERQAHEQGRVVERRQDLPADLLAQFPMIALEGDQEPLRLEVMDRIQQLFHTWQEAQTDGSLVIVGKAGTGKTTMIRQLERELGVSVLRGEIRTKITRPAKVVSHLAEVFGFSPKPSSEKELIRMIREDTRPAVVIENCHNLFLRQVGGFDGWETFVRVVNETCDNVFWFITFNEPSWDFLYNMFSKVKYFRRVVELPSWSEREIRRIIMKRMRRSGYGVSFSELVMAPREGVSLSAQLGRTSSGYFRLLWDLAGGNPRLACHYWLDSLVLDPEERLIRVYLFSEPKIEELERLSDDLLFLLTAIAEHENLTIDEVAKTTNLPEDFCNFSIRFCLEQEYLVMDGGSGRVRASYRWQRPLMRYLKRKHLLRG